MDSAKPDNFRPDLARRPEQRREDRDTILVGIDGTGELSNSKYEPDFKNSFVNTIYRASGAKYKWYIRGPASDGIDMAALSAKAYAYAHLHHFAHPNTRVLLMGYSRGGAGVIDVAWRLQKDGVPVEAMMLFDPVQRAGLVDGYDVPNNVLYMVKALRATMTLSRISFNNCATSWHAPTRCTQRYFWATHGGIGGCPWPVTPGELPSHFIDEDEDNKERLLSWVMYDVLQTEWKQPDDYRGTLQQLRDRHSEMIDKRTQVTYQQDRAGAEEVWAWVYPKLVSLGFLPTKA